MIDGKSICARCEKVWSGQYCPRCGTDIDLTPEQIEAGYAPIMEAEKRKATRKAVALLLFKWGLMPVLIAFGIPSIWVVPALIERYEREAQRQEACESRGWEPVTDQYRWTRFCERPDGTIVAVPE